MLVLVVMAAAAVTLVVIIFMVMVMMMMLVPMALVVIMFMVLMILMFVFFLQMTKSFLNGISSFHSSQNLLTVQRIPVSGYDHSMVIVFTKKLHHLLQFLLIHTRSMAENNRTGVFYLVVIELTEVLHIYFGFFGINYSCKAVELYMVKTEIFHRLNNIAKFSHA